MYFLYYEMLVKEGIVNKGCFKMVENYFETASWDFVLAE